jgi:anti-sigma factor RsiW
MNCRDALELAHAYIDGELELVKSLEIEQHLAGCAACKVQVDSLREAATSLRAHASYHAAPAALRARVAASLRREAEPAPQASPRGWTRLLAPTAFALLLLVAIGPWLLRPGAEERIARDVVAGHVRSMLGNHLTDVASSDQHTVKPWIAGKLDFSPPVRDLSAQGFVLAGGRLDYLDQQNVLALVYLHRKHVVNLFIWPEERDRPLRQSSLRGYNVAHFAHGGMAYWAVSDLNPEELKGFGALLRGNSDGAG